FPGAKLNADILLFPLDDELVAFSEKAQALVGLNATAAMPVGKLQEGAASPELADFLAPQWGVSLEVAKDWVAETLDGLGSHGLLGDSGPLQAQAAADPAMEILLRRRAQMPAFEPFEPQRVARYRLLGTHALIRYGHKDQMRMVDTVIGHLKSDDAAEPN